jgi:hypothetical protein
MGACDEFALTGGRGANSDSSKSSENVPAPPYVVLAGTLCFNTFFGFGGAAEE